MWKLRSWSGTVSGIFLPRDAQERLESAFSPEDMARKSSNEPGLTGSIRTLSIFCITLMKSEFEALGSTSGPHHKNPDQREGTGTSTEILITWRRICPAWFAAGDVRHGSVKRCASAVGEG